MYLCFPLASWFRTTQSCIRGAEDAEHALPGPVSRQDVAISQVVVVSGRTVMQREDSAKTADCRLSKAEYGKFMSYGLREICTADEVGHGKRSAPLSFVCKC